MKKVLGCVEVTKTEGCAVTATKEYISKCEDQITDMLKASGVELKDIFDMDSDDAKMLAGCIGIWNGTKDYALAIAESYDALWKKEEETQRKLDKILETLENQKEKSKKAE